MSALDVGALVAERDQLIADLNGPNGNDGDIAKAQAYAELVYSKQARVQEINDALLKGVLPPAPKTPAERLADAVASVSRVETAVLEARGEVLRAG